MLAGEGEYNIYTSLVLINQLINYNERNRDKIKVRD